MIFLQVAVPPSRLLVSPGDSWKAEYVSTVLNEDGSAFKTDTEEIRFTVLSKEGETYSVEISRQLKSTTVGDVRVPPPVNEMPEVRTAEVSADTCFALPLAHSDSPVFRLSRLLFLAFPKDGPLFLDFAPKSSGIPALEVNATRIDTRTWSLKASEPKGLSASGRLTLEEHGLPADLKWAVHGATPPGGSEPLDMSLEFKIIEFEKGA